MVGKLSLLYILFIIDKGNFEFLLKLFITTCQGVTYNRHSTIFTFQQITNTCLLYIPVYYTICIVHRQPVGYDLSTVTQ